MAKIDPTRKIRKRAAQASRTTHKGKKVFIDLFDGCYNLSGSEGAFTIMVYKNGSEIAL